jgi:DNA (cytosine-5)-methyltransferase 1
MKFIDLFAGIGGFRLALSSLGAECVFSSEWDKFAAQTYLANFGEVVAGDIHQINALTIPDHDILCGGFPCQPFSIAGVSKKNALGHKHGFEYQRQGNLFFEIIRIIKAKRPKILFLENVKNLQSHDQGNTWQIIKNSGSDQIRMPMKEKNYNVE